jgi:transglutaminase-like putative cysteine protease
MFRIESFIRLMICIMVLISGTLLGISLSSHRLVWIALVAGISGHIITDRLRWFHLDGILANVASILILITAMRDFFPQDSSGKLVSVANLLIYLQSLLMFQEKNPRLVWQILTLSLLQVVVAAIFSLNLEGGLLFLSYFLVAGTVLTLQMFFKNNGEISRANRASAKLALSQNRNSSAPTVLVFFDPEPRNARTLQPLFKHLSLWFLIALSFTVVMFYMIPRNTQPWLGGATVEITAVSPSKSVDLLNRGQISLSGQTMFRVKLERLDQPGSFVPSEPPYFRGIALSRLVLQDGHTNWSPPNDRVFSDSYQELWYVGTGVNRVKQTITVEENRHPVVYSAMPAFSPPSVSDPIEYCHEIAALTRCKINSPLELAPFKYELLTVLDSQGRWLDCWPYFANQSSFEVLSMADDPSEQESLTEHQPERYPTIVKVGQEIVENLRQHRTPSRLELCRAMADYFVSPGRFRYTLDYRKVVRDDTLDPNEDFVRNHRSGHCEMFASALTLMLRSQNIPARLVTGFHGGDPSPLSDGLVVRARHAHAWVEAYLRPEDCTPEMFNLGAANEGGAWLRLDPTPALANQAVGVGTEAIDLARSFWQDYILGMNTDLTKSDSDLVNRQLISLIEALQFQGWESTVFKVDAAISSSSFRYVMIGLIILPPLLTWLITAFIKFRASSDPNRKPNGFRRWLASTISLFSPNLGKWVLGSRSSSSSDTQFYERLLQILQKQGLVKRPEQSQREFAKAVVGRYANHSQANMIRSVVWEVSEIFNEVRFGRIPAPAELREQIDQCLTELEQGLATAEPAID